MNTGKLLQNLKFVLYVMIKYSLVCLSVIAVISKKKEKKKEKNNKTKTSRKMNKSIVYCMTFRKKTQHISCRYSVSLIVVIIFRNHFVRLF